MVWSMTTLDSATMRRLTLHEARVHASPGREVRDLGDGILLVDPVDPEPFWNRLAAVRWPADVVGFDRRLTEILVLFASLGRQPHIWPSPLHDTPGDLVQRLTANGFRDTGGGSVMVLVDLDGVRRAATDAPPPGIELERFELVRGTAGRRPRSSRCWSTPSTSVRIVAPA